MKKNWMVFVLLVASLLLLSACTTRTTDSSGPPLIPVDPPTQAPRPTPASVPTQPVADSPTQPVADPPTPAEAPPELTTFPEMTVLGTLASGIPYGVTAEGAAFKGDPNAPVMITEYSEYQ